MGQLGTKLAKVGAARVAIGPLRVSWLAARALLRRCDRLQVARQVTLAACASKHALHANLADAGPVDDAISAIAGHGAQGMLAFNKSSDACQRLARHRRRWRCPTGTGRHGRRPGNLRRPWRRPQVGAYTAAQDRAGATR